VSLILRVWAATDVGCVRQRNEDSLCIGTTTISDTDQWHGQLDLRDDSPRVVAVVDGMGGHRGGVVASRLVAHSLADPPACDEPTAAEARAWMNRVNATLYEQATGRSELCAMGATVAALWCGRRTGLCLNVGDARVYRHQDGYLDMRSDDHAIVLPDGRHRLLMSLGGSAEPHEVHPTVVEERLAEGRRYLLCSDGLSGEVGLEALEALMHLDPADAVAAMVREARACGGRDNITLALVEVRMGEGQ
jgi:serine/threonine protein phosphatase PrpC